jgi:alkanesulfonate monooxygenase SsuD/methylene tetrahydromethanopterin reductase-like flavin-dependent oxidoreductase (luciferase family)
MRFGTFSYNQSRPWIPEKQAFEELLEQILLTERLGFDDAWFAEHHHSDYGMLASPNLIIAALAHRTKRLRMGNLVNVLPLTEPMRLAEECAMLDILTDGRLNVGLGRGVPRDDLKHGLDRDTAQARFEEGIDILMRAWTQDTFNFTGKAWNYVDISCRPRPLQKPHPPVYYGATSPDSPSMVARRGWNLALSRQPLANCARAIKSYREERAKHENLPGGGDAIMVRDVYVADTDEQAWREAPPQITRFWQLATDNVWRGDSVSPDDLPKFTQRFAYFSGGLNLKRLDEWGTSLIGSPDTVIRKAREMIETARPDCLVGMFSFGGLKHEQVMRSIELFATKVMPALGA